MSRSHSEPPDRVKPPRLRRLLRWVTAGVALTLIGAVLFTYTPMFRELLRDQAVAAVNDAVRGNVSIARVDGSIWSHLTLRDVRVRLAGDDVLVLPRLAIQYDLTRLLIGRLDVTRVEIVEPMLHLRERADGSWNLVEAFASRAPAPPPAAPAASALPLTIAVRSVSLGHGRVDVQLAGEPPEVYRVGELTAAARVRLTASGLTAVLRSLTAELSAAGVPPLRIDTQGLTVQSTAARTRIGLQRAQLATAASRLDVHGEVENLADLRTNAGIRIERLAADEVRQILPDVPLRADVTGEVRVHGDRSQLSATLDLAAAGGRIQGNVTADLRGHEPRYGGTAALADVDLERLLNRDGLAGIVAADVRFEGAGTGIDTLAASATVSARKLQMERKSLGDVDVTLQLADGKVTSEGALHGLGRVTWNGHLELGPERYDINVNAADLDVGRIVPRDVPMAGALNLSLHVQGRGFTPQTMDTAVEVDLQHSQVGPLTVARGKLAARVAKARVHVGELALAASGTTLQASGDLGLTADAPAEIRYTLDVPELRPWLELAGQSGKGAVHLAGTARGAVTALDTDGQLTVRDARLDTARIGSGTLDFRLAGLGNTLPYGTVEATLHDLQAGLSVKQLEAHVAMERSEPRVARLGLDAALPDGLQQHARAELTIEPARIAALLQELRIESPAGTWQLERPARIVRTADRIDVDGVRLTSGKQLLTADGVLADNEASDLRVRAAGLQVGVVEPFAAGQAKDIQGVLDADVTVRGTLSHPAPSGTVRLRNGQARVVPLGVTLKALTLDADVRPDRIRLTELSARANDGSLRLSGGIVFRQPAPELVDVRLSAERWPAIDTKQYEAQVGADIRAQGPLSGPDISGHVEVLEAMLRPDLAVLEQSGPPPRDDTIHVVQAEGAAAAQRSAETAGPTVNLVKNLALDLDVVIQRNTWVKRDDSAIELAGTINVDKARGATEPSLTGELSVERGWVYFYGRRFEARRGVVTFTGGHEIDPSLDVVLLSRVSNYEINTIVSGTAQKPSLAFESQPSLEEADILSLLMFGKPVDSLGQGEQVALSQQATNLIAGYAASQVGQALGDQLGFQISELDVGGRRVGVGRYVTPNTYVSVTEDFSENPAREIQVQYYLTPNWTIQTEANSTGENGGDVFWQKRY